MKTHCEQYNVNKWVHSDPVSPVGVNVSNPNNSTSTKRKEKERKEKTPLCLIFYFIFFKESVWMVLILFCIFSLGYFKLILLDLKCYFQANNIGL